MINDGRLASAQMRSNPLALEDAKAAMLPLLSIANGGSVQGLDAFLQKVKVQPFLYEGEFHVGTGKRQNPMLIAAFSRTGLKEKPLALRISLEWQLDPPSAARWFYNVPIPPPTGYENVSMENPSFHARPALPFTTPSSIQQPKLVVSPATAAEKPSSVPGFPIVLIVMLVSLIIGVVVFVLRRKFH